MAELSQLERALVNADKAGDAEAAKALASEITRLRQQQGVQRLTAEPETLGQKFSGVVRGMRDPIDAGAQLLVRGAEKVGLAPESEVERVDQIVQGAEQDYRQNWRSEDPGLDVPRIAGNVLSPSNLAVASRLPQATSLLGRVATGATAGGFFGAMQPVTQGDFAEEKGRQIKTGAAAGAALPLATGAVARVVRPNTSPQVRQLMSEGVTPTPGQVLGGASQRAEQALTSLPVVGDAIQAGQRRAIQEFNKAALNRALKPIGETLPKNMEVGNRAIQYVSERLSRAYNRLLPRLAVVADDQFTNQVQSLRGLTQNLPNAQKEQFERILQNEVIKRFTPQGRMSGETMKNVESKLGELIRGYSRSPDYDQRALGAALRETQATLRNLVERGNPQLRGELSRINEGYSNFLRIQNAASRLGSKEGVFSPAQLRGGVRSMDPSKGKSQFARGSAQMQDLATSGESVLGSRVPDSGTPFRAIMNLGALGGAYYVDPMVAGAGLAATSAYTPMGQRIAAALLGKRPEFATPAAEMIRRSSQYLTPGAVTYANTLNKPSP